MKTPSDDLAARLFAASTDILRVDGEVRLDEVATTIGVPRATLYYYFSGRDDLTAYLITRHLAEGAERLAPALASEAGPQDRLRALLVEMTDFLSEHPGVCGGLLSAIGSQVGMGEVMAANDSVIGAPLRDLLTEGRQQGLFSFEDAADTANLLMGAILIAVLGRAITRRGSREADFSGSVASQLLRMVISPT